MLDELHGEVFEDEPENKPAFCRIPDDRERESFSGEPEGPRNVESKAVKAELMGRK